MKRIDGTLLLTMCAIGLVGWLVLCSATVTGGAHLGAASRLRGVGPTLAIGPDAIRQAIYFSVGIVAYVVCTFIELRFLRALALPLYALSVMLLGLVMVPGFGHTANGAQRWISLGALGTLQPSELAKLSLVLAIAAVLGRHEGRPRWTSVLLCGVLVSIPVAFIMLQPDLGTALVFVAVTGAELFLAGTSVAFLLSVVMAGVMAAPHFLKGYQRDRLLVFLNPDIDPRGLGYNLIMSRTAVGAGGIWGDGLFFGMMSQLHYVPEHRTDFIFSVMGEELGLVGCLLFLSLYVILIGLMLRTAWRCENRFGQLLVGGVCALFSFHVFVNVGMSIGLLPVVGIPLPFVSYGGTAALADMIAVGLVAAVGAHREHAPGLAVDVSPQAVQFAVTNRVFA